jgi:tight adherence protein C
MSAAEFHDIIGGLTNGDGTLMLPALVAAAVLLMVAGFAGLLSGGDPIAARLATGVSRGGRTSAAAVPIRRQGDAGRFTRLASYVTPADSERRSLMRERLMRAGYLGGAAVGVYFLARTALGLAAGVVTALVLPLLAARIDPLGIVILSAAAALIGYSLPLYWVLRRTQVREEALRDGFPDTLDMLLVCVEAGQALDAALARVALEVAEAHPVLAEELAIVGHELRAGKGRSEVLRDFARRAGIEDISAFITLLIQSDQFGTSIGDALRVYAREMRQKRLMRAEEKANKLPVKLALGTMVFTVPPVLLILIGPSLIMVMRSLARFLG